MGRRKIEIQPLSDERTRTVTFVKRKAGLFKKAYELSVLCEVDMAVIIIGNDRIYEYSSVDTKELIDYYQHHRPHELKLPENFGEYKKRRTLHSGLLVSMAKDETSLADVDADSGYESDSPEPKRQKQLSPSRNIYSKQPAENPQFVLLVAARTPSSLPMEGQLQRPVLRVQIPSEAKSLNNSVTPVEPLDTKSKQAEGLAPPPFLNSAKLSFNGRFRSPDSRKPMHQLHAPLSKLQSLSPSSAAMPQLPMNGGGAYFSSLPPPSPSGQYPPSILPTPVYHQVFNPQYMSHINAMSLSGTGPGGGPGPNIPLTSQNTTNTIPQMSSLLPSGDSGGGQSGTNAEPDTAKFKPAVQQTFMNGEQTPVSGLPSRYMSEIFPSPSNFYPTQEWATGLTPYSANMSHYFAGIPPSTNGSVPHAMNTAFVNNNRSSVPSAAFSQRQIPMQVQLSQNVANQGRPNKEGQGQGQQQQLANTITQPSSSEYGDQYYKK